MSEINSRPTHNYSVGVGETPEMFMGEGKADSPSLVPGETEAELRGEIARLRQENAELKEELGGYALPQFWGYCPTDDYPDWDKMPEGPEKDRLAAEGSQRFIDRMKADWFREHTFQKQLADALRAQLAAQWQPIATAPKDGTWIIGLTATGDVRRVSWGRNHRGILNWCSVDQWHIPTHWMPMPAAPQAPSDAERA